MNTYEPIRIDFDRVTVYTETDQNAVGATTSTTLREIAVHADANCIYVAKTGDDGNAGTQAAPLLTIQAAADACDGTHPIVTVLDSGVYDEEVVFDNADCDVVQADLGQTPTVSKGCGARVGRTPQAAIGTEYYVKATGSNADTGLSEDHAWQTVQYALANSSDGDTVWVCDSSLYDETLIFNTGETRYLLAKEGEVPTIRSLDPASIGVTWAIVPMGGIDKTVIVDGFIIEAYGTGAVYFYDTELSASVGLLYNCTLITREWTATGAKWEGIETAGCYNCISYHAAGGTQYGLWMDDDCVLQYIRDCYVHGYSTGAGAAGIYVQVGDHTGSEINEITDCVVRDCVHGILVSHVAAGNVTRIYSCLVYDAVYNSGLGGGFCYHVTRFAGDTVTVTGCIAWHRSTDTDDFYFSANTTVQYCLHTYADSTNETNDGTDIDGVPTLCDRENGFFGLRPDSNGWHVGDASGNYDIGPRWVVLAIDRNDFIVNGLNVDGNGYWVKGISHLAAQTGTTVEWCSVFDFSGVAVDPFHGSASVAVITGCLVHDSGCGLALAGGTAFTYTVVYDCAYYGIYTNEVGEMLDHSVLYGSTYGIYIDTAGGLTQFINSITAGNSSYGIYSVAWLVTPHYCCVVDPYNSNVTLDDSNIPVVPGFRSVADGAENFHLATVEGGYLFPEGDNNPLIEAGSDGDDIGAYDVERVETSDTWDSYTLATAPARVDFQRVPITLSERFDTSGVYRSTADAFQWTVELAWTDDQQMDHAQAHLMEYLFELHTEIRIYFAPAAGMWTGRVLYDADAGTATPEGSPAGLTQDEWKSWWMELAGVADPLKITGNTAAAFTLAALEGDAPASGWYDAVITFIRVKCRKRTAVAPVQKYYVKDDTGEEMPRTGFKIEFIEF